MKTSVLTVCRNAARTLPATLASFVAQDHDDKELIVVDGASSDNTAEVVARHRSPHLRFVSEPDRGMYDALNKGLRLAAGDAHLARTGDDVAGRGLLLDAGRRQRRRGGEVLPVGRG